MNEFVTAEYLGTFAGLVAVTGIVIQVLKYIFKEKLTDALVRPLVFIVSTLLTFIFIGDVSSIQGIVLTILNSILVTLSASGAYDYITDPKAKKSR